MADHSHQHTSLPPTDTINAFSQSGDDDEEIDQLDPDSDQDEQIPVQSSAKKNRRRSGERLPGQPLLSTSKLSDILKSDANNPSNLSKEAMFILSAATEEFIKRLTVAGHRESSLEQKDMIEYRHLAAATLQYEEFKVVRDIIPRPISVADAFERRQAKEKELLEDTPAISSTSTYIPSFVTSTGLALTNAQKGKAKAKTTTNGKPKPARSNTSSMTKRQKEKAERQQANGAETAESEPTGPPSASASTSSRTRKPRQEKPKQSHPAPLQEPKPEVELNGPNGFPPIPSPPWSVHPIHPHVATRPPFPNGNELPPPPPLPPAQHFMGPASGFLQDHRLPFGGDNAGRTIYSQR